MTSLHTQIHGWININGYLYSLCKEIEYVTKDNLAAITATFLADPLSEKRIERERKLDIQFEKSGSQVDIKNITEVLLSSNIIENDGKIELTIAAFCKTNQISIN
jgi:hypothetical protein